MRVRVRFAKQGKVRWISARDLARAWERAFRRARVPVSRTAGFSPRPRVSFGLALPTGAESVAEYLDVETMADVVVDDLVAELAGCLPTGIVPLAAVEVDEREGSLQGDVTACRWELEVQGMEPLQLADAVRDAMLATALPVRRTRKGRDVCDDLRPSLLCLECDLSGRPRIVAELATKPRGVRPVELLRGLGSGLDLVAALRTHQWIERDGARREPIPLGATAAQHALGRAS